MGTRRHWAADLTADEREHLRQTTQTGLRSPQGLLANLRGSVIGKQKAEKKGQAYLPCYQCRAIARKLGIDPDAPQYPYNGRG